MQYWDNFIKNLKHIRKSNNLTQQQLADQIKISRTSYRYIESHSANPPIIETLEQLCEKYGLTPNDLFIKDLASGTESENNGADLKLMELETLKLYIETKLEQYK